MGTEGQLSLRQHENTINGSFLPPPQSKQSSEEQFAIESEYLGD